MTCSYWGKATFRPIGQSSYRRQASKFLKLIVFFSKLPMKSLGRLRSSAVPPDPLGAGEAHCCVTR